MTGERQSLDMIENLSSVSTIFSPLDVSNTHATTAIILSSRARRMINAVAIITIVEKLKWKSEGKKKRINDGNAIEPKAQSISIFIATGLSKPNGVDRNLNINKKDICGQNNRDSRRVRLTKVVTE